MESKSLGIGRVRHRISGQSADDAGTVTFPSRPQKWLDVGLGFFRRKWFIVPLSVFAVVIMLTSSLPTQSPDNSSGLSPASSFTPPPSGPPPYYPYIVNASMFPAPGVINGTGALSLPQLAAANSTLGLEVYDLMYVSNDSSGNENLSLVIGVYNASAAQSVFQSGSCSPNCSGGLPLQWGAPVLIHSFGKTSITGDFLATSGTMAAAAATVANKTYVYLSSSYGASGSWGSVAGGSSFNGSSPRLVVSPCTILLTTVTGTSTLASTISLACGEPYAPPAPNEPTSRGSPPTPPEEVSNPTLGGTCNSTTSPTGVPYVWGVVAPEAPTGTNVWLIGTNLESPTSVHFGTISATVVRYCATSAEVTVPSGLPSSAVDVVVTNSFGHSLITPSDMFKETSSPPTGPWVTGVDPDYGSSSTSVAIIGSGFHSGMTLKFGGTSATPTVSSSTYASATAPSGAGTVNVTVTYSGKTSLTSWADLFTYGTYPAAPTVSSVSPNYGLPCATVVIRGSWIGGPTTTTVEFGGESATNVTVVSASELTAVAPSGTGMVDVNVTNNLGTSFRSSADLFTYGSPPPPAPVTVTLSRSGSAQPFCLQQLRKSK
jgi:large repetitive protein